MRFALQHDLKTCQEIFFDLISAPTGVADAADDCVRSRNSRIPLEEILLANSRMNAVERLDIYATMYFYRIHDVIAEDLPTTRKLVGKPNFHNLITDYLLAHPSRSWTLHDVAKALPDFARKHSLMKDFPYLHDILRLERTITECFFSADATAITLEEMQSKAQSEWLNESFMLTPAAKIIKTDFVLFELMDKLRDQMEKDDPLDLNILQKSESILIWRKDFVVQRKKLSADEILFIDTLKTSGDFISLCEDFGSHRSSSETNHQEQILQLVNLLLYFVKEGLLVRKKNA